MNLSAVIVATGLTSILGASLSRMLGDSMKYQKNITISNDLEVIRMQIQKTVDCPETLKSVTMPCKPGEFIELKGIKAGKPTTLVRNEDPPTRFDKIVLRAECAADGEGIVVKHSLMKPGKSLASESDEDFLKHPIFNQKLNWSHKKAGLFPEGITFCSGKTSSASSMTAPCYISSGPYCGIPFYEEDFDPNDPAPAMNGAKRVNLQHIQLGRRITCAGGVKGVQPVCIDGYAFFGAVSINMCPGGGGGAQFMQPYFRVSSLLSSVIEIW